MGRLYRPIFCALPNHVVAGRNLLLGIRAA